MGAPEVVDLNDRRMMQGGQKARLALQARLSIGAPRTKRLDRDTAGCLVLGRTKPALAVLGRILAEGLARKIA